jgi:omega-6 fatty acid desaturase (delta-12 desaturase)
VGGELGWRDTDPDMTRTASSPKHAPRSTPTMAPASDAAALPSPAEWRAMIAPYQQPDHAKAAWQVVNSHGSYLLVWLAMIAAWQVAWWLALPLAFVAAGLLVRIFIVSHDCGHGSFTRSRVVNSVLGFVSGVLTFVPFRHWTSEHAEHHRTSGDLDRRGVGDIWTMTLDEYVQASRTRRVLYRLSRNPFILFVLAPLPVFVLYQRFATKGVPWRDRLSVWATNIAIVGMIAGMIWAMGLVPFLVLQGTATLVSGAAGMWLFYVQHQHEDAYWRRTGEWNYTAAALVGSSFYRLPRVLQWFTGNIGFHHIHHLDSRIPNYHLEACHRSQPLFQRVKPMGLRQSWRSASLVLWDEARGRLVDFREARRIRLLRTRAA